MVRYLLVVFLLIFTCSTLGQDAETYNQKNGADKSALLDVDLSAKVGAQEDTEPLNCLLSTNQLTSFTKASSYIYSLEEQFVYTLTRYSINTRAPPYSTSI
ncbi:hypothetical protein ACOYR1_14305 [Thalassotalea piscium]